MALISCGYSFQVDQRKVRRVCAFVCVEKLSALTREASQRRSFVLLLDLNLFSRQVKSDVWSLWTAQKSQDQLLTMEDTFTAYQKHIRDTWTFMSSFSCLTETHLVQLWHCGKTAALSHCVSSGIKG